MTFIEIPVPFLFISSCIDTPKEWKYELENSGIATELDALNFDEVVIPDNTITIRFNYPFSKEALFTYKKISKTPETRGYTREELIRLIGKTYYDIYNDEAKTTGEKVVPIEKRDTLMYRNQTDGKYGIWGFDIDDLMLARVLYNTDEKRVYLDIDS